MMGREERLSATPDSQAVAASLFDDSAQNYAVTLVLPHMFKLFADLEEVRTALSKQLTARMALMDRIAILSGSTLTLIFTVLGILGSRLQGNHQNAIYPKILLWSCWSFCGAICFALLHNSGLIKVQAEQEMDDAVSKADANFRYGLLKDLPHVDPERIPKLQNYMKQKTSRPKWLRTIYGRLGTVSQLCILAGFVLLILFIQFNVSLLLQPSH